MASCTPDRKQSLLVDRPVFYRLQIVDLDGSMAHSTVLAVRVYEYLGSSNGNGHGNGYGNGNGNGHAEEECGDDDDNDEGDNDDGDEDENDPNFCQKHPDHLKCRAMPLILEYFNLRTIGNQVLLKWRTTYEQNLRVFNVQRSYDGLNFMTVGKVIPQGAGYYYSYVD